MKDMLKDLADKMPKPLTDVAKEAIDEFHK